MALRANMVSWIRVFSGLSAACLVAVSVGLPAVAWFRRESSETFNAYVGWANIAGMSVGAIALVLLITDKLAGSGASQGEGLDRVARRIATSVLRTEGDQLARLLATDELDSRGAHITLARTVHSARKSKIPQVSPAVDELVDEYLKQNLGRMLITGPAGAGKSVALLRLVTDLAARRGSGDSAYSVAGIEPVAVVFSVHEWRNGEPLEQWISKVLAQRFGIRRKISDALVENRYILPVLDSFDETLPEGMESSLIDAMVRDINSYMARTVNARMVIACRSDTRAYSQLRRARGFVEYRVQPIKPEDIAHYIAQHEDGHGERLAWASVLKALPNSAYLRAGLGSPWRLAMAVSYCHSSPSMEFLFPTPTELRRRAKGANLVRYLKRVDEPLYDTFIHTRAVHYNRDPVKVAHSLRRIACRADMLQRTTVDGAGRAFLLHELHRDLGNAINSIQLAIAFAVIQIPFIFWKPLDRLFPHDSGDPGWLVLVNLVLNFIILCLLAFQKVTADSLPARFGLGGLRATRGMLLALGSLVLGIVGIYLGLKEGMPLYFGMGVATCLTGMVGALTVPTLAVHAQTPKSILLADLFTHVAFGLTFGLFSGLYNAELLGGGMGVGFGLAYFLVMIQSSTMGRYIIATAVSYFKYRTPLRLASFLQWAHKAGLVRLSGVAYEFRHKGLEEHLLAR